MLIVTPEEINYIHSKNPKSCDLILKDIDTDEIIILHYAKSYLFHYRNKAYILNPLAGIWVYFNTDTYVQSIDYLPNYFKEIYSNEHTHTWSTN